MPISTLLAPEDLKVANKILEWAHDYLMKPHPDMKRPYAKDEEQTVCPFVKASVESNAFYIAIHNEINGHSIPAVAELLLGYVDDFKRTPPFEDKQKIRKAVACRIPSYLARSIWISG